MNRKRKLRIERLAAVLALGLVVIAWAAGRGRAQAALLPAIRAAAPGAEHVAQVEDGLYAAWDDAAETDLLGYVALGQASGYGGPLTMAVFVDLEGRIISAEIVQTKDTPSWVTKVQQAGLGQALAGKAYGDAFQIGDDLDGVSGATYTSRAMAQAALNGSRAAGRRLDLPVPTALPAPIVFGARELVLVGLFALGYVGHRPGFRYKKPARWTSILVGLIVLGFVFNAQLTLANIVQLFLGYWPDWRANLYWYLLLGGVLLVFTAENKNPYCEWFCPFGAAQECLAAVGGAKARRPGRAHTALQWLQRGMAFAAVLLGVYFLSPGLASYEIFGVLFGLMGSSLQFAVLGLVLVTSIFVLRPWCGYLCPIKPVFDLFRLGRAWAVELWQSRNRKKPSAI